MARNSNPPFGWDGGALPLDFANTMDWRHAPGRRVDLLRNFDDLAVWGERAGVLARGGAARLQRLARAHPRRARAALARARTLRETIYALFSAPHGGKLPAKGDLDALNRYATAAVSRRQLVRAPEGLRWDWIYSPEETLDGIAYAVAIAATELLTSERRTRVQECAAEGCGWLFLDRSRNRRRRWCDMTACGNRSKARRFYQRTRGTRGRRPAA